MRLEGQACPLVGGPVSLVRKFEVYLLGNRELLKEVAWADHG